eukprot:scaffold22607_cov123-Cylindrotheca_fusiformis.AAC.11
MMLSKLTVSRRYPLQARAVCARFQFSTGTTTTDVGRSSNHHQNSTKPAMSLLEKSDKNIFQRLFDESNAVLWCQRIASKQELEIELLDKPKDRLDELVNLVQTHILLLNPDDHQARANSHDQAERIAWYIEAQYQNIVHDLPDELYRKARIAWVDLPDFSNLKDATGKVMEPNEIDPEDILPTNWVRNIANDGSFYYWNTKTREAQWERPK